MLLKWFSGLFGDTNEKRLEKIAPLVNQINEQEPHLKKLSDSELAHKTVEFRERLSQGAPLEEILPESFAVVREASLRTTSMRHFDVQLMGGIVLHQGGIAEMTTGEGKTLVATLPVYLNALTSKGVHLVTVNDYLAKRDSEWMGPIYNFLGLSVGLIQHDMAPLARRKAYASDIVYGTNNEFGFDYLRDNMAISLDECVGRDLHYAIVDEVDSILIDEARTPLIISGVVEESLDGYFKANRLIKDLENEKDFSLEEKTRNVTLTEAGIHKLEKILRLESLYDVKHMDLAHQITQALRAHYLFRKDIDYIIKDGEIVIVDEFTGRLMFGRRYSEGLHQAIEAKEKVEIRQESQTLASITFQNYFRMYQKLAGMTGTAMTEEAEFAKIYNLDVVEIPTNKKLNRISYSDVIYKSKREKFNAVVAEITEWHQKERPVLVGTISIEDSENLSLLLTKKGIKHHVLNAKQHEREAEIISHAGQKGMVTISTNMAGRGTDIVLGEGVKELAGLHVIGTERHESRRIDNQLRGRAGRQGDPGSSRFYVSLEDNLMRLFGSDRIAGVMDRLGVEEGTPIEHPFITRGIENSQKKVEQYHFNIRKQILEFDDVMNKQRESIYSIRRNVLKEAAIKEKIFEMAEKVLKSLADLYLPVKINREEWDFDGFSDSLAKLFSERIAFDNKANRAEIITTLLTTFEALFLKRETEIGREEFYRLLKIITLKIIDNQWIDHLHTMDSLREGIGLRAYGQRDPLIEYKVEAYRMFQEMMERINYETLELIFKVEIIPASFAMEEASLTPQRGKLTYGAPQAPSKPSQKPSVAKSEKVGRNDPCPCGSGKKFKKCCGKGSK